MKKKHIIIFICAVLIVAAGLVFLLKKDEWFFNSKNEPEEIIAGEKFSYTPVMYKICDDDNCNYLVGAMHLGDAHIKDLSDKVINAYNEMDSLAVEIDTMNENIDINEYLLPNSETIDNLISEELNSKLEEFSSKHILFPYEQYKNYELGFFADLISTTLYLELGFMTEGVDSYFLTLAHQENKKIIPLETLESQMSFFSDYSDELYMLMIEDTIDTYDEQKELVKELYDAYLAGDAEKIKEAINSENEEDETNIPDEIKKELEAYQKANASEGFLANNQNVFVTVGAAHVVADDGIVELLKAKGYEITQMN